MKLELLGKKLGMSQVYDADNNLVPVTIIRSGSLPCLQVKTVDIDGYYASSDWVSTQREIAQQSEFLYEMVMLRKQM